MTIPVTCPRCMIPTLPPLEDHYCPLCVFDRVVPPELATAYRLLTAHRSLNFRDVWEIRATVLGS
jgi:hypothetical protein